jgi:hypothetical protein
VRRMRLDELSERVVLRALRRGARGDLAISRFEVH